MKHPDGRSTVVPIHGRETIGVGLMSKAVGTIQIAVGSPKTDKSLSINLYILPKYLFHKSFFNSY